MHVRFTGGSVVRVVAGLVYLVGTGLWLFLSALAATLRCDDSCVAPRHAESWRDTSDAWQWSVVGWLGLAGGVVALAAVAASWFWKKVGVALFAAHVAVFATSLLILIPGADTRGGEVKLVLAVLIVGGSGVLAVAGSRARRAGSPRAKPPRTPNSSD